MSDWYTLAEDGATPVLMTTMAGFETERKRVDWVVGKTDVGAYHVSTVFLFLDHGWDGEPVLWETLVSGDGAWDQHMQRYTSREDAEAGHQAIIERITATADTDQRIRELQREAERLRDELLGYE